MVSWLLSYLVNWTMKIIIWIILGTIIVTGILGGSYFFLVGGQKPAVALVSYSISDKERPKVEVKTTFSDFGKMKVSDERSAQFTLKNIGQKPLQLSNISSSCMCTAGQLIIDGKESEEFGMHGGSDYVAEVLPGHEAKVKLTYRPYQMPVYGVIEREVYVTTNDPTNEKLVFKAKANVH